MSRSWWLVVPLLSLVACASNDAPGDAQLHTSSETQADTVPQSAAVLTQHNDMQRTGRQLYESVLTPSILQSNFGRTYYLTLDGYAYAQPLYVPNLAIAGGTHNVVFVATENNSVYAFDADNYNGGAALWQWPPTAAERLPPEPTADVLPPSGCIDIKGGWIGITGTPVIDATNNKIYFVTASKSTAGAYSQTLYAVDIRTGQTVDHTVISQTWPDGGFNPSFDPRKANQRAGLLYANGHVWVSWASHCSDGKDSAFKYSGWVMAFDATNLSASPQLLDTAPSDDSEHTAQPPPFQVIHGGAGVWMGGTGPTSDGVNVWVSTGNGFNGENLYPAPGNRADSVLRLGLGTAPKLAVNATYLPADQESLYENDWDVSADGLVLLPSDDFTATGHTLLAGADKTGVVFVLDATTLQSLMAPGYIVGGNGVYNEQRNYGAPAYYNGYLYYAANGDNLKRFKLSSSSLVWPASATASGATQTYGYPGSTPSISAWGSNDANAIVWTVNRYGALGSQSGQGNLYANYANQQTGIDLIYDSSARLNAQDNPSLPLQFQAPTIAGGHVFISGGHYDGTAKGILTVYGVALVATPAVSVAATQTATGTLVSHEREGSGAVRTTTLGAPTVSPAGLTVTLSATSMTSDAPVTATFDASTAAPGTYTVTFSGTMTEGTHSQTYTTSTIVTVTDSLPHAAFTPMCTGRRCSFDASASTGTNLSYAWTYGDGMTGGGQPGAEHYQHDGTYTVMLTVSNAAGSSSASHVVTVSDPPPIASFTYMCTGRACTFTSTSTDVPGPLSTVAWQFGDSHTASGSPVNHTYGVDASYLVNLTVIDSEGQQAHQTQSVHVVDARPIAALSVSCTLRACTATTTGTSDDLGIATSSLAWGDGTTASGPGAPPTTLQHTFAADGTYTVRLTVTDTGGQSTTTPQGVTVPALGAHYVQTMIYGPAAIQMEEDASASVGPYPIVGYHWVWADGTVQDTTFPGDRRITHSAAAPTLTVTDSMGNTATTSVPDSSRNVFGGGPIGPPQDPGDPMPDAALQ